MYYFIVNPASSSGNGIQVWKQVEELLEKERAEYEAFVLSRPGEATALASRISSRHAPCTIVAIGGDGTINEVINGLCNIDQVTFACIPSGSGNDFARGMRLPSSPLEMAEGILHPRRLRDVNIGKVSSGAQSRRFIVSSGAGFDASVCYTAQNSRLKSLLNSLHGGKLVYSLTALWLLATMKRLPLRLAVDGRQLISYNQAYFAAAMNLRYEGGGFRFCPSARPGDDLLDLCIAGDIPRWKTFFILPLAYFGKHVGKQGIQLLRCRKITIHSPEPVCVHTDGEIFGFFEKVSIQLLPKKLTVITG